MPKFLVRVQYSYEVQVIDPKDALDTVPQVIKGRFMGFHGEGKTEILNAKGEIVLTAKLVTEPRKKVAV